MSLEILAVLMLASFFVLLLAGLVTTSLPAASLWPVAFGIGMGLTLLLAFGLPPVLQLAQVPPLPAVLVPSPALNLPPSGPIYGLDQGILAVNAAALGIIALA